MIEIQWRGGRGWHEAIPSTGNHLHVVRCAGQRGWVGTVYLSGVRVYLDRRRTLAEAKAAAERAYRGLENAFRETA